MRQGVSMKSALPATRCCPKLDDLHAEFDESVQQPIGHVVRLIEFLLNGTVEADCRAEMAAQKRNIVRQAHGAGADDAEVAGGFQHDLGLLQTGSQPAADGWASGRIARPGAHNVSMDVDERTPVAKMPAVRVIDTSDVVLRWCVGSSGCSHVIVVR